MVFFSQTTTLYLLAASLGILGLGLGANAAIFMKIVLSNLPAETAGTGTGIYGLFRDLAAPFGVAVFVPMFTNQITRLAADPNVNLSLLEIAVDSIHMIAAVELFCVVISIFIVQLLPKIHQK